VSFLEVQVESDILKAIKRGRDKFKPLGNYLKDPTGKTFDRNIELLGWLLDFEPRPFVFGRDYKKDTVSTTEKISVDPPECIIQEKETNAEAKDPRKPADMVFHTRLTDGKPIVPKSQGFIKKLGFIAGGVVIASGLIAAVLLNNIGVNGCMIWVNDHYESISCDSSGNGRLIVAKEENDLRYMRRITRPDTLKETDIGNVWYRKRGGDSLDYYTIRGRDPVDPNQDLKQLTVYIFDKYLKKNIGSK
jgi:hypothetical protein